MKSPDKLKLEIEIQDIYQGRIIISDKVPDGKIYFISSESFEDAIREATGKSLSEWEK